jgi:CTP:molybdopterin cytidylyltransferase MocA
LFPWSLQQAVFELGPNEGVNVLLKQFPVKELPVDDSASWTDIDRPEDYRHLLAERPGPPHQPGDRMPPGPG